MILNKFEENNHYRIDTTTDCWEWIKGKFSSSYGNCRYKGRSQRSHRVSYEFSYGKIKNGLYVLHKCDNKSCINPKHLYLGTQADNMKDMVNKGRSAKGENQGNCKLTDKQVRSIRGLSDKYSHKDLSRLFNVGRRYISAIINNEWRKDA